MTKFDMAILEKMSPEMANMYTGKTSIAVWTHSRKIYLNEHIEKIATQMVEMAKEIEDSTDAWFRFETIYPEGLRASWKDVLADNKRLENEIEKLKEQLDGKDN